MAIVEPLIVPDITLESRHWTVSDSWQGSRRQRSLGTGEYQSAVPATIADIHLQLPADLAADIEEAAAALTRFDHYAKEKLGASSLMLSPMANILLRTESASSSQIENITVRAKQLALAAIGQSTSQNANLINANVRAMESAINLSVTLNGDSIRAIQAELMRNNPSGITPGQWRTELVWIGTSSLSPIGARYVAPQPEYVVDAINDLIQFIERDDLPVVAQMAIAHAQFETIHPFPDGNGRTGRALIHAIARNKGLVTTTTPPISAGLLRDTTAYFQALTSYRDGDARPIVECVAAASRFSAKAGAYLVDKLVQQLAVSRHRLDSQHVRADSTARKILPFLVSNPIVDAAFVKKHLGVHDPTAQRALATLVQSGVLVERSRKKRNRVYEHKEILEVLDDFAIQIIRH